VAYKRNFVTLNNAERTSIHNEVEPCSVILWATCLHCIGTDNVIAVKALSRSAHDYWPPKYLALTADDVGCDLPVTEPVSFHGPITVWATEVSLLLDPEYGMLYLQNSDTTSALDFLGANWSRICLSRTLNHGALWHIVFLRLRNIITYLLTYLLQTLPNWAAIGRGWYISHEHSEM